MKKIVNLSLLLAFISSYAYAEVEFSGLTSSPSIQKSKSESSKYAKSIKNRVSLGNYVWFDSNENGQQDLGELGVYNVKVNLYNNATCSGGAIASTTTADTGYYEFKNLKKGSVEYCIGVVYPNYWTHTIANQGKGKFDSNLISMNSRMGRIPDIILSKTDMSLDAGLHHRNPNCQTPVLKDGLIGVYGHENTWARRYSLDVKINDVVAQGFCHEVHDSGPKSGEHYTVHSVDRKGFSSLQRDRLSRIFSFMSDPDILTQMDNFFEEKEREKYFNFASNTLVWYYSDWNRDFSKVEDNIYNSWWNKYTSNSEKAFFTDLIRTIISKVEGKDGYTQYPAIKVYYLWNEDTTSHQDIIVPSTLVVPNQTACTTGAYAQASIGDNVWLDSNYNGIQDNHELGLSSVSVSLYDKNNQLVEKTVTNNRGKYLFQNQVVGNYHLKFAVPNGYTVTSKAKGNNRCKDSDTNSNGKTGSTQLTAGENDLCWDMGLYITPHPVVDIEVSTNGDDADKATGPSLTFDEMVRWKYVVKNNGNVALNNVVITDSKLNQICTIATLAVRESKSCTKTGKAIEGQYENLGTVTAKSPQNITVKDQDPSHYIGGTKPNPAIDIEVSTNGKDADKATGPSLAFDETVTWTYVVQNKGNIELKNIVVTDSKLNQICTVATLAVGENKTCTKTGKALEGQYENIGTVIAKSPQNITVKDQDLSHYIGGKKPNPKVDIEVSTNGKDADKVTGPTLDFHELVTWEYVVTNNGNVELKDIVVTDNKLKGICTFATLAVGASKTCKKTGKAIKGQYSNIGTVKAKSPKNVEVTESDPSHYIGGDVPASISIEKSTNGKDADSEAKAVELVEGDEITWTYVVKNIGKVTLTKIIVTDNKINGTICTVETLAVGESKTCTKTGVAKTGLYVSTGKVTAEYEGETVEDSDKSYYDGGVKPETTVSIGDFVWWDKNANGIQDNGEVGIDNVEVKLLDENDNLVKSTKTDGTGNYSFLDVSEGRYKIQFVSPNGFRLTSPKNKGGDTQKDSDGSDTGLTDIFTVTLNDRLDIDMGFVKGTAPKANNDSKTGERCTVVVQDVLQNDSDTENDLNVSSVNFVVPEGATGTDTDKDGDIDKLVVSEDGTWSVDNGGKVTYTPNGECTGHNPTAIKYTVSDNTKNTSNEATISVVYPDLDKAQLGDKVWFDADKNGKQNAGESGLKNITVELYDANGDLNGTTLTDENGTYVFVDLEAGEYSVKFIAKEGWSITKQDVDGVDESKDSDADTTTGMTKSITLNDGDKNMDIDAGMYQTEKPSIKVVTTTNGGNVANIVVGDIVKWTYLVTNTGNTVLTNIVIKDDKEGEISNCTGNGSLERLNPTQSITCEKVGTAILGIYNNTATVTAVDPEDKQVKDEDSSSYVGKNAPVTLGSIGAYVWLDSNKDGIQNDNLPLNGIKVILFDKKNKKLKETTTDASGKYLFPEIEAGTYYLKFVLPNGYTVTSQFKGDDRDKDSDADANGKTALFTVDVGQEVKSIAMGIYPATVDLGNRVWYDTNKNGIQDIEEKDRSLANIAVKLYKENGEFVAETKTRDSGYYHFIDVIAGKYYVVFDIPDTYKASPKKEGSNKSADSDADPVSGKTDLFTLVAGIDNPTIDMGLYQEAGKVGDRVWYDANKNGIQDAHENGVGEVEVKLYRVGEANVVAQTKTSATGIYLFDKVIPAEYYIVFTAPVAYTITDSGKGTDSTDSNPDESGRTENFTVNAGTKNSTIDMGVYQNMVSLGDRVWLDTNHDGLQNIGESGVRDVNVTLYSATSDFSKSMLTDENGNYIFTHLSAGEYSVEFRDIPYGHLITTKDTNGNESDLNDSDVSINADEKVVTEVTLLTPGENDLSWDMGIYKTVCLPGKAVLGNLVWEDFNKDGIQDIGERGVAKVKVELFNNDTDEKVATVVTDENGLYEFAHISPEFNYYVQFTVPDGYVVSPQDQDDDVIDSDVDENGKSEVITVVADQINSTVDMGIYTEGSTIGDRVWYDEKDGESNGIQDVGEQGVHDLKVTLYDSHGNAVQTTRTNASGEYHFTNVIKGTYTIGFSELPNGYIFTKAGEGADAERDSDAKLNGRTNSIRVNGKNNITSIDAGIKEMNVGYSGNDIKRGISGQDVVIDVLANDREGTYTLDPKSVKITSTPEGSTLSDDGKTLTVPREGVWSVNPETGVITFIPEDGFVGDPTAISYGVKDTHGNETTAEVNVNYPPVANDDNVNGEAGKQIVIHVVDNDTNTSSPLDKASVRIIDPSNGDEVEILVVNGEGTWSTNSDGTITFTPEDGFVNNPTPIEYTIKEQEGDVSNRATVTIIYPDAVDDTVIIPTDHEGVIVVIVANNDSNNTDPSTVTLGCTQPGTKTLTVNGEGVWSIDENGNINFTPETGFKGEPTDIKYTVELLSGGRSNCANVDIRYELLARDDRTTMNVGGITVINVLSNDFGSVNPESVKFIIPENAPEGTTLSDDGKTLTVLGEGVWSVNNEGVVKFIAEDGFTHTPTPIKYTVDNNDGTHSNMSTITLVQGGKAVIINNDTAQANGENPVTIDVLGNDIGDINGSTVLLVNPDGNLSREVSIVGEGIWSIDSKNRVIFTPMAGYTGTPTPINYVVRDRNGNLSEQATIQISGICSCKSYDDNVPVMGGITAFIMVLLTLLWGIFLFRKEEKLLKENK